MEYPYKSNWSLFGNDQTPDTPEYIKTPIRSSALPPQQRVPRESHKSKINKNQQKKEYYALDRL